MINLDDRIEIIDNYQQIVKNAVTFNDALKKNIDEIINLLSNFRQWYYIEEIDDFAPSKFIGYKNMTAEKYINNHTKTMDGRETELVLKKYFTKLEYNSCKDIELRFKLSDKIEKYGKKLRKNAIISVKK